MIRMDKFTCRYCGKEKDTAEKDHDAGRALAEHAAFLALGHTGSAWSTPYLVCKDCAKEFEEKDGADNG